MGCVLKQVTYVSHHIFTQKFKSLNYIDLFSRSAKSHILDDVKKINIERCYAHKSVRKIVVLQVNLVRLISSQSCMNNFCATQQSNYRY
jgi:hypothetical protein